MILAGGVGSRFWPASTPERPKQLLPLAGDRSLIRTTTDRVAPLVRDRIRVVAGRHLVDAMRGHLPELTPEHFLVEPRGRGTAPALVWAAHALHREAPAAVMASLHADHAIADEAGFRTLLSRAARLAVEHGRLFTVGAAPTRPETGYGYIHPGAPLDGDDAFHVDRFVEKPPREVAERYLREGYLWNTGIFVWPVALFLEEIRRHTPELAELLPLLEEGDATAFFEAAPNLSVDHGVLERSDRVATVRAALGWDDVGTWDALLRTRQPDGSGNVGVGRTHFVDASGSIAWDEEGELVLFGVEDLVVVRAGDVTFVSHRSRLAEMKALLERLPEGVRDHG